MKVSGKKLSNARCDANMTRSELAIVAGVTHQRIWQVETELFSNMNPVVVNAIARKLKVSVSDLQHKEGQSCS